MCVDNGLGETGGSGSEEEDSLGVGLCRGRMEIIGGFLGLSGLLDIVEQLDVQASGTCPVELTRSDLIGQPDGFDRIGGQERVEVLDVSLAMVELGGEIGEETRDEAGVESRPDGQHVVLVGGQVDNHDRLLASRGRTEGGCQGARHGLSRELEPCNVFGLDGSRRGDKGERAVSVGLCSPREQIRESPQVR